LDLAATFQGQAVDSTITLNILFNPANMASRSVDLNGPDLGPGARNSQSFTPPHVRSATYASDPATTLLSGAVALDIRVDKFGRIRNASAIFTTPSLTDAAISAVKKWRFTPGLFHDSPIDSNTVVVFVFRPPTTTTPPGSSPVPIH